MRRRRRGARRAARVAGAAPGPPRFGRSSGLERSSWTGEWTVGKTRWRRSSAGTRNAAPWARKTGRSGRAAHCCDPPAVLAPKSCVPACFGIVCAAFRYTLEADGGANAGQLAVRQRRKRADQRRGCCARPHRPLLLRVLPPCRDGHLRRRAGQAPRAGGRVQAAAHRRRCDGRVRARPSGGSRDADDAGCVAAAPPGHLLPPGEPHRHCGAHHHGGASRGVPYAVPAHGGASCDAA